MTRSIDLHAALTSRHGGRLRFLVLEEPIRRALSRQIQATAETTDVLPLPISKVESEDAEANKLTMPLRIRPGRPGHRGEGDHAVPDPWHGNSARPTQTPSAFTWSATHRPAPT